MMVGGMVELPGDNVDSVTLARVGNTGMRVEIAYKTGDVFAFDIEAVQGQLRVTYEQAPRTDPCAEHGSDATAE